MEHFTDLKPSEIIKLKLNQSEFEKIFFGKYPKKNAADLFYKLAFDHFVRGKEVSDLILVYDIKEYQAYSIIRTLRKEIAEHFHLDLVRSNLFVKRETAEILSNYQNLIIHADSMEERLNIAEKFNKVLKQYGLNYEFYKNQSQ